MAGAPDPDRESDRTTQARGWARVARASADVYDATPAAGANAALFDAIEYAATEARLGMGDLVDAYIAGAPQLDIHEAWDDVEDYLGRIARMHEETLGRELARIDRALPDWRRRLAMRIAVHDLALAAHRALGGQDERIDRTRRDVQEILDGARDADATEDDLDAYIAELRIQQCDLAAVIITAAWIAAERTRLAQRRATPLPRPAWATVQEIADDRGVSIDVVVPLIDNAVGRGLLEHDDAHGVTVTAAGHEYLARAARE